MHLASACQHRLGQAVARPRDTTTIEYREQQKVCYVGSIGASKDEAIALQWHRAAHDATGPQS